MAPHLRSCTFRRLTGIPCPTCGTTRTALALLGADPVGAFLTNPLAAVGGIVFIIGGAVALVWLLFRFPILSFGLRWSRGWAVLIAGIVLANWAYLIATH